MNCSNENIRWIFPYWNILDKLYMKRAKLLMNTKFLQNCINIKVIPNGLRLHKHINLNNRPKKLNGIKQILCHTSTNILFNIYNLEKLEITYLNREIENLHIKFCKYYNIEWWQWMMEQIENKHIVHLKEINVKHNLKLLSLKNERRNTVNVIDNNAGSIHVIGDVFTRFPVRKRPHRRGVKKCTFKKCEVDLNERDKDPIVLAKNVHLNKEQIDICRMSDKFIPTPTAPVDVSELLVGTHEWAERLRWKRYHFIKNKNKNISNENEFIKLPWYRKSDLSAPKGDKSLELFIEKCTLDFINEKNRKKIKNNLTVDQRKALKDLKNLPTTYKAACRFADKSSKTVITSLEEDDDIITKELNNPNYYNILDEDPTDAIKKTIFSWADKYENLGAINEDISIFVKNIEKSQPAKCKPLIKTHKPQPFPYRMLLASSGSPTHPLSKFIQLSLSHLTKKLPYQLVDTKAFINKIEVMNKHLPPLDTNCILVSCDVEKLYPSVDNSMGIPAVKNMLENYPSPLCGNVQCIMEGLEIVLNNNVCKFTKCDGSTIYALPNNGTAMGPCHAPDYVDVFMGILDQKLVEECPVNLITSTCNNSTLSDQLKFLNWSRYRDDGFIILPNKEDLNDFKDFLMKLCPNKIKWTVESGRSINFLDVTVFINDNGKLSTDVYSKNCHSYLSPNSCHNPCTFRGLAVGMGRRLRLICSDDNTLKNRIIEYTNYLVSSGWKKDFAFKALTTGANVSRNYCLKKKKY